MTKGRELLQFLDQRFPLSLQLSFDNSGFLVGDPEQEITKVLLALDVTDEVIREADEKNAQLIISHHPVIWTAMKSMTPEDPQQIRVIELIRRGISVISFHTNLDIADGGVNDLLMDLLGGNTEDSLDEENCGRIGTLRNGPMDLQSFLVLCKEATKNHGLRYYDAHKPVYHLAVMGGSGGSAIRDAVEKGCDTYVTGDIKYDQFLLARQLGLNLIDADHFCTENPILARLRELLAEQFPEIRFEISEVHDQTAKFF